MIKITFTGDALCQGDMIRDDGNYNPFFENIKSEIENSDYAVCNLETPVAGEELIYTNERYCFNTPEQYLDALKNCRFNLLTLANNHCMDRGEEGIHNTLENCRKYGFETVGLYNSPKERDKIFVKEIGGIKVAFLNYTYGTNAFAHHRFLEHQYMVNLFQPEETLEGSIHLLNSAEQIESEVKEIYGKENETYIKLVKPYIDRLKTDIKKAKEIADYVVMIAHTGGQYNTEVEAYTKFIMNKIKSLGADIIVGHHAHIIQKCNTDDGYLTVNCLGNFMYSPNLTNNSEISSEYSALLNLYLEKENGKVKAKVGFKLLKVIYNGDIPTVCNTYKLFKAKKETEKNILFYANRFAGKNVYTEVSDEYIIEY